MAKSKPKVIDRKVKETAFTITNAVNVNFRSYAFYVLENRGIPAFQDALTNVQRFILMNANKTFNKSLAVVGSSITDGYHHGNASIEKAINKVTKEFGSAETLLIGDGFFGSPVKPEASAARYTSVKLNPIVSKYLDQYIDLNKKEDDSAYSYIRSEIPLGLLTTVVGIGVGYASMILPRAIKDIEDFLEGKKSKLLPSFKNFNGRITAIEGSAKSWMIEGSVEINEKLKEIKITELPPLMKYDAFINKKVSKLLEDGVFQFVMQNDSTDTIDIVFKYKGGSTWDAFKEKISKMIKMTVSENIILIKDGQVIEYNSVQDYLSEFKIQRERNRLERSIYDRDSYSEELEFLKAKKLYLEFMIQKKRSDAEIETFVRQFKSSISSRLLRIYLRDLNPESIKRTEVEIKEMNATLKKESERVIALEESVRHLIEITPQRSKVTKTVALIDDSDPEIESFNTVIEEESDEFIEEEE